MRSDAQLSEPQARAHVDSGQECLLPNMRGQMLVQAHHCVHRTHAYLATAETLLLPRKKGGEKPPGKSRRSSSVVWLQSIWHRTGGCGVMRRTEIVRADVAGDVRVSRDVSGKCGWTSREMYGNRGRERRTRTIRSGERKGRAVFVVIAT